MSKYLKADEEKHHYEAEIHQKTMHEINRVNTFRTMSNEYQDIIQSKYADDLISHSKFGLAQHYYGVMEHLTNLSLLEIENKLYAPEYEERMKEIAHAVDELEKIAK
jgi:hypothetical protein